MFGLGDAFKKPEGSWDCDTCFVQNKAADVKCVACQTPKPGATVESNGKKKTKQASFKSNASYNKNNPHFIMVEQVFGDQNVSWCIAAR